MPTLAQVIASFLAAGAGASVPPEAAALLAGTAPLLAVAFEKIADRVVPLRQQRCGDVYSKAATLADMSLEQLTETVLNDQDLLDLCSRILLAVQDMALDEGRRCNARVLAACALDPAPARLDIGRLAQSATNGLDGGHMRLMAALASEERRPNNAPPGKYGLSLDEVVRRDPGLREGALPLLQGLISRGIVEDSTGGSSYLITGRTHTLSSFGQRILILLGNEGFKSVSDSVSP